MNWRGKIPEHFKKNVFLTFGILELQLNSVQNLLMN